MKYDMFLICVALYLITCLSECDKNGVYKKEDIYQAQTKTLDAS